jgi:hypothetical protein
VQTPENVIINDPVDIHEDDITEEEPRYFYRDMSLILSNDEEDGEEEPILFYRNKYSMFINDEDNEKEYFYVNSDKDDFDEPIYQTEQPSIISVMCQIE